MGYVEVEACAAETRVAEEELDAAQVDAGFEQMRREAVTKQMGINGLGQLSHAAGLAADMGDAHTSDGLGDTVSGKEPGLELIELPLASQQREQIGGEHHEAITLPFALAYADDHALGVDVRALEVTEFRDPHTGGIEGGENGAMLEVTWGQQ
jgi:hypothetical protein